MRFRRVKKFSSSITQGLLPSQQSTFSHLVCSMLLCRCMCLAELARCLNSKIDFRHNLKRVWRFVSNDRINQGSSKEVIARRLIHQIQHRQHLKPSQPLEIIIDWTTVWPFQVLQALVPLDGRAVPLLSWVALRGTLTLRQNTFEMDFLASLRRCLPKHWKVVIVADRGFGRVELMRYIKSIGLSYVIRVKADAWIKSGRYEGKGSKLSQK